MQPTESLPLALVTIVCCFLAFALITSSHLSPNLNSLSKHLRLSPRITGLTLLSLGNATPDIFTTYTALSSHSTGLAMGELLGSANFVICVVFCSMGFIASSGNSSLSPLHGDNIDIMRDIVVFGVFVSVTVGFLFDSKLWYYECIIMVVGYLVYMGFIVYNGSDDEKALLESAADVLSVDEVRSLNVSEVLQVWRGKENVGGETLRKIKSTNDLLDVHNFYSIPRSASTDAVMLNEENERNLSIVKDSDNQTMNHLNLQGNLIVPHISINGELDETSELIHNEIIETQETTTPEISNSNSNSFFQRLFKFLLPDLRDPISIAASPITIALKLIIPTLPRHILEHEQVYEPQLNFKTTLFKFQTLIIPPFFTLFLFDNVSIIEALAASIVLFIISSYVIKPQLLIPIIGFATSLLVILLVSTHLIKNLLLVSEVLHIPHSLLGLTVLTIGNSVGDLIANLTLAKLGHVEIAMGACIGGPLSYIVLGLGVNGLLVILKNYHSSGGKKWIDLDIDNHFYISFMFLLLMVLALIGYAVWKEWRHRKRIQKYAVDAGLEGDIEHLEDGLVGEYEDGYNGFLDWKVGVFGIVWWLLGITTQIFFEVKK